MNVLYTFLFYQSYSNYRSKIFIGGLTWNTTKDMLHSEFSKYGEIVDSIVMKNPETDKSRGFGFVTYKENSSADEAVNSGSHKIDGKIVNDSPKPRSGEIYSCTLNCQSVYRI